MDFAVLGPVLVRRTTDEAVPVGGLQGLLLAMLLAHANQPVPAGRLIDVLWGSAADDRAAHRLQTHVYRLRRSLGQDAAVCAEAGGYRVAIPAGALDAERFESMLAEAGQIGEGDPERAVQSLRQALALWRGEAYEGHDVTELRAEARRLQELRLSAIEQLYRAELACGRRDVVCNELPPIVVDHPLHEGLHELLITGLAMAGRQADALAAYHRARSLLIDELGIDPGPRLRNLEMQILNGEPLGPAIAGAPAPSAPAPAQLPMRPSGFTGRQETLESLNQLLDDEPEAARLVTVTGSAGVGKTALAVHWAHQTSHHFPDGQLYVNLHGYSPDQPLAPAQVLGSFLRALGVDSAAIPEDPAEKAALFRSEVAGRRILILLDNARDVAQVRPLLPGSPTCVTVITSREVLAGLTVQEGARDVGLSRMADAEARQLLAHLLDAGHDPQAMTALVRACAQLPLALRIAAERVRTFGPADLPELTEELKDEQLRLDLLESGDQETSVRGVFSWSYRDLSSEAAWLFRCLGATPAHEMSAPGLAAMADLSPGRARRALDVLRRAHLVEVTGAQRYRLHDLLGSYAAELGAELDDIETRAAAFARLCDYYLRTTAAAVERFMVEELSSAEARRILDDEQLQRPFESPLMAARWLEAERENLVLAAERAAREAPLSFPTTLSTLLSRYLDVTPLPDHAERMHTAALIAARGSGEINEEGSALRMLGLLALRRDRLDQAQEFLQGAAECHDRAGDRRQKADAHNLLAGVAMYAGRIPEAIEQLEQAIAEARTLSGSAGCYSMANYGLLHFTLGRPQEALSWLEASLKASEGSGTPHGQAVSMMNLVPVLGELGEYQRGLACADRALALARELGRPQTEAKTLIWAGGIHRHLGDLDRAREHYDEAMAIAERLDTGQDAMVAAHIGLGEVLRDSGEPTAALHHQLRALELAGDFWQERSGSLLGLGATYRQLGEYTRAAEVWREVLSIYENVGHARIEQLRERLEEVRAVDQR